MFCHKCGNQVPDGAKFCQKCGTKIIYTDTTEEMQNTSAAPETNKSAGTAEAKQQDTTAASAWQKPSQMDSASSDAAVKKKSKKKMLISGAVALVVIAVIIIALNWNGKINYTGTVGAHTPFKESQGLPYTYEEVLNKYIESPEWEVRKDDNVRYIDISGTIKGKDNKLLITIKVSPNPDNPDGALITPERAALDDIETETEDETLNFLFNLFCAYDEGYSDLSWLDTDRYEESEAADINEIFYTEYEKISKPILLDWFDRHPLVHDIRIRFMNEVIYIDGGGRYLMYEMDTIWGKYGTFYINPDNGDIIMDSIIDDYGSPISIQIPMEQWYLEYYWGWTEDSGSYSELYSDNSYTLYDGYGVEILEYSADSDAYVICNYDLTCFVEYDDGSVIPESEIYACNLIGYYGYDASFEAEDMFVNFYYSLQIDFDNQYFIITETWRGNTIFEAWAKPDSVVGNTLTFEILNADGTEYHWLTYIPADKSPLGQDLIYIDGDETMPFVRE